MTGDSFVTLNGKPLYRDGVALQAGDLKPGQWLVVHGDSVVTEVRLIDGEEVGRTWTVPAKP